MSYVSLDPPGSICQNAAIRELIDIRRPRRFVEVGVGGGSVARMLCRAGWHGCGLDSSPAALERARQFLAPWISDGRFQLHQAEGSGFAADACTADVVISMMVLEHQEQDRAFLGQLLRLARSGGTAIIGVPARMDKWSLEDDTVGHYRRYERRQLEDLLAASGLRQVLVRSVAVPTANALFWASTRQVKRHARLAPAAKPEQTAISGIREIPFKTVFPAWCRLLLNDYTMWPLCQLQRLFYGTNLGLTLIARGEVP